MSRSGPGPLVASNVAQYFPECPFCHAQGSMGMSSQGDFVSCSKCGTKWKAQQAKSSSEIVSMEFVAMGTDERGVPVGDKLSWIDVKRRPEFWRQRALGMTEHIEALIGLVTCPRCGAKMRWIRRVNTYICDNDGYLLGKDDPFLLRGEVIPAHNAGGQYNH